MVLVARATERPEGVSLEMHVQEGATAAGLLADPGFCREWDVLYQSCPWATAFQSRSFATAWYGAYASVFEPLLVHAPDAGGGLAGLFTLARNRKTNRLVHAGANQAEYHAWLSRPGDGDAFIEAALDGLASRYPSARLSLQYLPPGRPLGWLEPPRRWAARARFRPVPRPLMTLGEGNRIAEWLHRKNYRRGVSKLTQMAGPVELAVLRSRQELEAVFDRIADCYDFRCGARYRRLPFRDDPLKKEFYLRLADLPDITHTSLLRAGSEILAFHIGARSRAAVHLGLISQCPFHSEHSPGVLLLLFLGRELAAEGVPDLDLTPAGDYKDRFASHSDTVYAGNVFFRRRDALAHDLRRRVAAVARHGLTRVGVKPAAALGRIEGATRVLRKNRSEELVVYRIDPSAAAGMESDARFRRDSLADLLLYEQVAPEGPARFEFLREAYARLERGGHLYTAADGSRLMHCAWLGPAGGPTGAEIGGTLELPPESVMLGGDYTHPASRGLGLREASLCTRLRDAAASVGKGGGVFISVPAEDAPARSHVERLGFQRYASGVRQTRWGKTTTRWIFES